MQASHVVLGWFGAGLLVAAGALGAAADQTTSFRVQGVERSDRLNIRLEPHPSGRLVGTIPPDGRGIRASGRRRERGSSVWWEVSYGPHRGWVNARFLTPQAPSAPPPADEPRTERPARPEEELVCFLNEPIWRIELRKDGSAACTDMCQGPSGLRAEVTPSVADQGWTVLVRRSDGQDFMALALSPSRGCKDEVTGQVGPYEVVARRSRGQPFKGCCFPSPS